MEKLAIQYRERAVSTMYDVVEYHSEDQTFYFPFTGIEFYFDTEMNGEIKDRIDIEELVQELKKLEHVEVVVLQEDCFEIILEHEYLLNHQDTEYVELREKLKRGENV